MGSVRRELGQRPDHERLCGRSVRFTHGAGSGLGSLPSGSERVGLRLRHRAAHRAPGRCRGDHRRRRHLDRNAQHSRRQDRSARLVHRAHQHQTSRTVATIRPRGVFISLCVPPRLPLRRPGAGDLFETRRTVRPMGLGTDRRQRSRPHPNPDPPGPHCRRTRRCRRPYRVQHRGERRGVQAQDSCRSRGPARPGLFGCQGSGVERRESCLGQATRSRFHLLSGSHRICPLDRVVGPPLEWGWT